MYFSEAATLSPGPTRFLMFLPNVFMTLPRGKKSVPASESHGTPPNPRGAVKAVFTDKGLTPAVKKNKKTDNQ